MESIEKKIERLRKTAELYGEAYAHPDDPMVRILKDAADTIEKQAQELDAARNRWIMVDAMLPEAKINETTQDA